MENNKKGTLYICGVPIGNLGDITIRQLETLRTVDLIACEDTRHTLKMLNHYGIKKRLESYHEHNAHIKSSLIVMALEEGKNIALVSDAGMPLICDPGFPLVKLCREKNITVTTVPGPTAAVSAIILSGLDFWGCTFYGFFPEDKKKAAFVLERLKTDPLASMFYEAPHRLLKTLNILKQSLGGKRTVSAVREITKKYEESQIFSIDEAISHFSEKTPRGEFVLIVQGISREEARSLQGEWFADMDIVEHVRYYLNKGNDKKSAMKAVAKDRGISKSNVYKQYLEKNDEL